MTKKGYKFSEEHRKKISQSLKGRVRTPEHCKHISEAKLWMVDNQIARRNLEAIDRIALVMKGEELVAAMARERQLSTLMRGDELPVLPNLANRESSIPNDRYSLDEALKRVEINTRKEMASRAKVSGEYRRDINDYVWLCVTCHHSFDDVAKRGWITRKQNTAVEEQPA